MVTKLKINESTLNKWLGDVLKSRTDIRVGDTYSGKCMVVDDFGNVSPTYGELKVVDVRAVTNYKSSFVPNVQYMLTIMDKDSVMYGQVRKDSAELTEYQLLDNTYAF